MEDHPDQINDQVQLASNAQAPDDLVNASEDQHEMIKLLSKYQNNHVSQQTKASAASMCSDPYSYL